MSLNYLLMKKFILSIFVFACTITKNATAQYWSALGAGVAGGINGGSVSSLAVYNGELYAGGSFNTVGGIAVNNIAKWNGTNWSSVGSGIDPGYYNYHNVSSLITYNGELYASGYFSIAGGVPANNIAKWNGTNWSSVGSGVSSMYNLSISLAVYNGELYASGLLDTAGGIPVNNIAKWNGTNWSSVGSGTNGWVHSLATHNGELYAGGRFSTAGGIPVNNIAKWNKTNWSSVGSGIDGRVYSLATHNDELYAGGNFDSAGGASINNIAKWNGTNWLALNSGMNGIVSTMSVYDGSLYAGGSFDSAGSVASDNIAVWNGSNWTSVGNVGSGMYNGVSCLTTYNGAIYAGGKFYTAGNVSANHIAKWTNLCTAAPTQSGIIIGDTNACQNGYLTYYSISPVNNASDYTWNLPSGWTGISINNTIATIVGDSSGIISVVANNPCGSSIVQTLAVTANQVPLQPGPISGNNIVCENSTQTYIISPVTGATSYSWSLPYGWIGNSTTNSITVTAGSESDLIYVTANNNSCSSDVQTFYVSVNLVPPPDYINGNDNVCQNSSQTYSINPVPGATSYTWNLPSGWTGNSATTSINAAVGSTNGIVSVTTNYICGSSTAQTLAVTVINNIPAQPGAISGNNSVCQNSFQTYSINPVPGAVSYTWVLPSGWTGSSATTSITTTAGNTNGNITVIVNNSCGSSNAQTLAVSVGVLPAQPDSITGNKIAGTGQTITYSINPVIGANSYLWSLDGGGMIVSGQNTNSIIVNWQTPGNYAVSVKASNSCGTSIDQTLAVSVSVATGVINPSNSFEIKILPNPSPGEFYLKAKEVQNKVINVEVLNMAGQLVYRSGKKQEANDYTQLINLDKMPQGIYAVKIMVDDKVYVRSVVINN